MNVLVACEFSGTVAQTFRNRGHSAFSCDLLPSELCRNEKHTRQDNGGQMGDCCGHWIGDVREVMDAGAWDLMIAHPPCTHLAVSGARWFKGKEKEQFEALEFVRYLMDCPVPYIALENPISVISSKIRKPDQIIQPWMFGHGETKATCLWLKGLPKLVPTNIVKGREARVWKLPPSPDRWKERSRTYQGIADAMADQWGDYVYDRSDHDVDRCVPLLPRRV